MSKPAGYRSASRSHRSNSNFSDSILPPDGRAPDGQMMEYSDRRAIVSAIENASYNRSKLQSTISESRGQASSAWEVSYAKERVRILNDAIGAAKQIASDADADWSFKREMVQQIMDYAKAISPRD